MNKVTSFQVSQAVSQAWSSQSSSKWTEANPARGQCGVTAIVVQELLGGDIYKTKLTDGWHYYNRIEQKRYDLSKSQFQIKLDYSDTPSSREEAWTDTTEQQYRSLKERTLVHLDTIKQGKILFNGTPLLHTERLLLRRFSHGDVSSVFANWISDERVTDNRVNGAHKSIAETEQRVAAILSSYQNEDFCYWAITLKETGELIGEIDLYDFGKMTSNCAVGYSIGFKWWSRGYCTEALKAVVSYGFEQMNVHKIEAAHNTDNPASGKVLKKAGMQQEGVVRDMIRNSKGQYKDCAIWGILQTDYVGGGDK
ncbi:acetyltransferase, GNAT family [Bacillus sp. JCM 19046]|nr:acetyltransferase, GNAT family [Bacillus sp. JCM 19045]GAF17088.1 acetyltransferase, GNAT family [Bacillus sp. JCM 19046]